MLVRCGLLETKPESRPELLGAVALGTDRGRTGRSGSTATAFIVLDLVGVR
jgi:hypothetical protein